MKKILIEQGSEAWFDARCGRITGTRFALLMSGTATKGYKDLILDIVGEVITGEVEETYSNANMERGKELESFAQQEYESIFDIEVEQVGFCTPEFGNEIDEWIGISPDGLIGEDGQTEYKCPLRKTHLNYIQRNELPNEYKWQVQGGLYVTEREWCDFMSYYPNMKPFIIRVYQDKKMHIELEARIKETITKIKDALYQYEKYNYIELPNN